MYNDKLLYNVYIWVLFGIIFGKENEAVNWEVVCSAARDVWTPPPPPPYRAL